MATKKYLLFISILMLMILISDSSARTVQITNSENQAIAIIDNAVDKAMTQVMESINNNPAAAQDTITDVFALINDAFDKAIALIQGAVTGEIHSVEVKSAVYCPSAEEINSNIQQSIETIARILADKAIEPNEIDIAGSIIAGMASAYELIGTNTYRISAELAGKNIISTASGNFKGDEVFALVRLSQISDTPCNNLWWTELCDFYRNIQNSVGGTEGYISQFADAGPSTAVFNLAYYTISAYYVKSDDKEIWRRRLANYLAQIDDGSSDFPVMVLGMATWALAITGKLDDTLLDPSGTGAACWNHKKLKDLPAILLSHHVPAGLYAGSFFRRFDHGGDNTNRLSNGCEDTIFATLGLIGAYRGNPNPDAEAAITAAKRAIVEMIDTNGTLCHQLECRCLDNYRLLAAEVLQALGEMRNAGDIGL